MGIDYDAKLIIGWELDHEKLREWKKELGMEICCSKQGYICDCDDFSDKLPEKFLLVRANPYFDCPYEYKRVFLTYFINSNIRIDETKFFYDHNSQFDIEKISKILEDRDAFENAREFAEKMGGEGKPQVMAVPHIF